MEEEKKEEAGKTGGSEDAGLAKELERIRGRYKLLKILTALLFAFFIIILLAAAFIYHRIVGLREMFTEARNTSSEPVFPAQYASMPNPAGGSFGGITYSTQSLGSSLGLVTGLGPVPGEIPGLSGVDPQKMMQLGLKYVNRPIVKDFIAELNKDPEFKKAFDTKAGNPLAMLSALQNQKSMQKLAMKFALRPDFMPFMQELMNDPQIKPLLSRLPVGNMGQAARMFTNMTGRQTVPGPQAVSSVTALDQQDAEENGDVKIDPSVVGGAQQAPSAPLKKKPPPPMSD
ncbi:MAG: hypothetical protein HY796_00810 [Elusimicrobia bacterium]|nr:hypothetical protein [Elusimicrobiota bacterium]